MASMVIRNIPDDVLERFRQRAEADGKSTEEFAREVIAEKGKMSREEAIRRADEIRASTRRVDAATWQKIWDEHIAERDARPYDPTFDDDR